MKTVGQNEKEMDAFLMQAYKRGEAWAVRVIEGKKPK